MMIESSQSRKTVDLIWRLFFIPDTSFNLRVFFVQNLYEELKKRCHIAWFDLLSPKVFSGQNDDDKIINA